MNHRLAILIVGTVVVVLSGGCGTQALPPTDAPASPTGSPDVVASGPPPSPMPSPSLVGSGTVDPATFLQVCDRWPDDAGGEPIECDRLVRTALSGLPAGDPVSRVQTSYTCATSCKPLDPDRGYALVFSGDEAAELEVVRNTDGSYGVAGTTSFDPPDPPTFDAPPIGAPTVDGAPASVNGREPLPLCGVETRVPGDAYDTQARRCFWDGVSAGSPVEFIDRHPDTEGLQVSAIYRYAGTGGITLTFNDEGGWWLLHTGVAPSTEEGRVFDTAGLTDRQPIPAE